MPKRRSQTTTTPKVVIGYVRISVDRDTETSTATQEDEIRRWCEFHRYTLRKIYVERGVSAFSKPFLTRPEARKAMREIETGQANMLVSWKLDRAFRNTLDAHVTVDRIAKIGGYYASVTQPIDSSDPITGTLMLAIFGALAELESRTKSDRTTVWVDKRIAERKPHAGPTAYGYTREGGEFVIDPTAATLIREASAGVIAGESLRSICAKFNAAGLRPRLADEFTRRSLKQMLTRPTVAGLIELDDGSFVKGSWEPIVDRQTWDAVRSILLDPARRSGTTSERRWLLSGLAECGRCGSKMGSRPSAGVPRLGCTGSGCSLAIDAAKADEVVEAAVTRNLDRRTWTRLKRKAAHVGNGSDVDAQIEDLRRRLDGLDPDLAETLYAAGLAKIAATVSVEPIALPDVDDLRRSWGSLTVDEKRLVISTAVGRIVIEPAARGANRFDPDRVQIPVWNL